jgi:hypothetical protein
MYTQVAELGFKSLKLKVGNVNCFAVFTRQIGVMVEGEKYVVQDETLN